MTPESNPYPRRVRVLGILTLLAMLPLVALGGQTTSTRSGMADPVWPTAPWYLIVNSHEIFKEPRPGFILEHTHRLAGWITGGLAAILAFVVWFNEPSRICRLFAWGSLIALLAAYGDFHRAMMKVKETPGEFGTPQAVPGILTACAALLCLGVSVGAIRGRTQGGWPRALATMGLIAVMIQGLLGGFRVSLNYWFGTNLSTIHGVFAQVVFCTYVATEFLASPVKTGLTDDDRQRYGRLALTALALTFLQLIFGALTRHYATGFAQRLHLLTAFAVTAQVIWLGAAILMRPTAREILGRKVYRLFSLVGLQVALGVEAYLGKFASLGESANLPPSLRPITDGMAITRTNHVLIGLALLASLLVLCLRIYRRPTPNELVQQAEPQRVARSAPSEFEPAAV